ncbi:hypothetical protein Dimus_023960 [Dionaea muscipula]
MAPVKTFTEVIESSVAPERLFKAIVLDGHNLLPKLIPGSFESIEIVEGESIAVGSVKKITFAQGHHYKYAKQRIDELNVDTFYCKYTITESDLLDGKYEYIVNEIKYDAVGTGSICKLTSHLHLKEGVELNEERIKVGHEKMEKSFKIVEEYLIANPQAYA